MPQGLIYAAVSAVVCLGPFLVLSILARRRNSDRLHAAAMEIGLAGILALFIWAVLNAQGMGHWPW